MKKFFTILLLLGMSCLLGKHIGVITEAESCYVMSVNNDESFDSIREKICALQLESPPAAVILPMSEQEEKSLALLEKQILAYKQNGPQGYKSGACTGQPREYFSPVTVQEKQDLKFIVMTLANKSVVSLAFVKTDLENAGERIEHLHPFKFLKIVFTDEEMKAGIQNIRTKGWVWNSFLDGLKRSLECEWAISNITQEHVCDFAKIVSVDVKKLDPAFCKAKPDWELLVNILIKEVPRSGEHNRYDN